MAASAGAAPLAFTTCRDRAPVQCADLSVPIDRANPGRGTLSLHVERIPAKGTRRGVMVFLMGGPGQAGTPLTPDDPIAQAIPAYDLVMIDQRGTGKGALRCRALDDPNAVENAETVGQCAAQVGPNRAFYATRDSVLDLDDLRQGLGVESFALGGISYGTYVTQYYAQQFPTRVSHMVLDSVVDPVAFDGFDAPVFQAAGPVLTTLCGNRRCAGVTPDPVGDVAALVAATATRPLRGYRVTERGRRVRSSIGGPGNQGDLAGLFVTGDMSTTLRAMWPGAARAARMGDAAPMLRLATFSGGGTPTPVTELSSALYYATACVDPRMPWAPTTPPADRAAAVMPGANALGPAAFAPFSAQNAAANSLATACTQWPEAGSNPLVPGALPAVPTIVLGGALDARTPVASATAVASRIPGASVMIAPGAGHSLLYSYACAQKQVRNFMYGRAVSGSACNREVPVPQVVPVPPATLASVRPSGAPGTAGRVARAARLTVQDGVLSMAAATESGLSALPGIRGGLARQRGILGTIIAYSRFSAVKGVAITGTLEFNGKTFQGALRVNGPGRWDGTLYLARGGQRAYTGSIGGVPVRIPLG